MHLDLVLHLFIEKTKSLLRLEDLKKAEGKYYQSNDSLRLMSHLLVLGLFGNKKK
jgi:hypothetical protein